MHICQESGPQFTQGYKMNNIQMHKGLEHTEATILTGAVEAEDVQVELNDKKMYRQLFPIGELLSNVEPPLSRNSTE